MRIKYVAFDIETLTLPLVGPRYDEVRGKLTGEYEKESTIEKHIEKYREKEWPFDAEGASPICVSLVDNSGNTAVYSNKDPYAVSQFFFEQLAMWGKSKLVGFNCKSFDLPTLIKYAPPENKSFILSRYDIIDLIKEPFGYNMGNRSLAWYARVFLGKKKEGNGSEVAQMWEKDPKLVEKYCMSDSKLTMDLFLKFSQYFSL